VNAIRFVLTLSLLFALGASSDARAAAPFSVVAWVDQAELFVTPEYSIVQLHPGSAEPVLRRPMTAQATAALSRDRQTAFVVSAADAGRMRIEVLDAVDLRLRSSMTVQPPFFWSVETAMAQHPTRPEVLMLSRCWWLDLGTGEWVETPATLGVACSAYAASDGLSASGRYLLLDDVGAPDRSARTVVVDVANPRVLLREFPEGAGPLLDDAAAVLVQVGSRIELHPMAGSAMPQPFPIPPRWTYLRVLGTHRGVVYARGLDAVTWAAAIVQLDVQSGEWTTVADPVALDFGANMDVLDRWVQFVSPATEICLIVCIYTGSSQVLLDTGSGATVQTVWPTGGVVSRGRALRAGAAPVAVDAFTNPVGPLLLAVAMLLLAGSQRGRRRATLGD